MPRGSHTAGPAGRRARVRESGRQRQRAPVVHLPRHTIDELPLFSPWPARLLGLERWEQCVRTSTEIDREFEREKWGRLLERTLESGQVLDLAAADRWTHGGAEKEVLYSDGSELLQATVVEAHQKYRDLVAGVLKRYLPVSAIAELGAGYGSIVIDLARRPEFSGIPFLAGELTESGARLLSRLSRAEGVSISSGHCDLMRAPITALLIPRKALIYTSYAAQYLPLLPASMVDSLIALKPAMVVHFEPCYEHCDGETLLGMMRRRYIQLNDYNTNLVTVLRDQSERGAIELVEERPAVFGSNPLLAASVIVWKPLARS